MPDPIPTPATRSLQCVLSSDELLVRGRELAVAQHERRECEARRKAAMATFKDEAEEIDGKIRTLTDVVRSGLEWRDVDVETKIERSLGVARVIRLDTGEVVETRPLSAGERQLEMFTDAGDALARRFTRLEDDAAAPTPHSSPEVAPDPTPLDTPGQENL